MDQRTHPLVAPRVDPHELTPNDAVHSVEGAAHASALSMNAYLAHAEYLLPKVRRERCPHCERPLEQAIPAIKLCGPCLDLYLASPPKRIAN
ncbi:MAG TPA: hypothetical protein V6D05_04605 [Stenomitos sp.]